MIELPVRQPDKYGEGHWQASRGRRKHNGIDYVVKGGDRVYSPCEGRVTKHGYPYADDLTYQYVQITDANGDHHRLFYVYPLGRVGRWLLKGEFCGYAQSLQHRYPGITDHVHYEIKRGSEYIEPGPLFDYG